MFSKSASSMFVAFFMISVVFTGCLDEAEDSEDTSEVLLSSFEGTYILSTDSYGNEVDNALATKMSIKATSETTGTMIKYIPYDEPYQPNCFHIILMNLTYKGYGQINRDTFLTSYKSEIISERLHMDDNLINAEIKIEMYDEPQTDSFGNEIPAGLMVREFFVTGVDSYGQTKTEMYDKISATPQSYNNDNCMDVTVDSLEDVFNSMVYDGEYYYTEDEWVIHDISEIVEIHDMLMFGVTGKAQEDGYNCGLETWYIFPGESTFTPGQCLLSEKPAWHAEYVPSNDGALWAPNFYGSSTMYYTVPLSNEDSHEDTQSCIGMITATGTAPNLVWEDHGSPIICQEEGEENNDDPEPPALDPAIFIDDDGRMYMVYGGAHIWITELNPETGEHISGDPLSWDNGDNGDYVHLANGAEDDPLYTEDGQDPWAEAPYLHKEGDYYYLFVNWYSCCAGADSTYEIIVGRSESVTGPYLDDTGTDLREFGGTLVIAHESHDVIGPGHAGIFEYGTGEDKVQVFTHHYYPDDGEPWAYAQARTLTWMVGLW